VRLGERGARGGGPVQLRQNERAGVPGDEHRRGVEDVLAGRAVVGVGARSRSCARTARRGWRRRDPRRTAARCRTARAGTPRRRRCRR
jgi:hypothetical protein